MKTKMLVPLILIIIAAAVVIGFVSSKSEKPDKRFQVPEVEKTSALGVCPPFYLLTEEGDTINPMNGLNIAKPYSPKQTCGKCHDYNLITKGYHFQQGKDEKPMDIQSERMQWVSSPGNYGGPWCSPAPLYRYLSDKENDQATLVDMTSFDFVVSCGVCHPGGGSLELDREGLRYDKVMADENKGFSHGWMNLVKWSNLNDKEFMIELFPLNGMQVELKYNRFIIPQPEGTMINGNLELLPGEKHLGNKIDLHAKYNISRNWQIVTSFGLFLLKDARTAFIEEPGNAYWLAFQFLYTFNWNVI